MRIASLTFLEKFQRQEKWGGGFAESGKSLVLTGSLEYAVEQHAG